MILDTNILVGYLNGDEKIVKAVSGWKQSGRTLFVSSISKAETLALPALTQTEIEKINAFLNTFISIPFDDALAVRAASFKRAYRIELPDAAIAATAALYNLPLVTRDKRFRKIREITVVEI